jgi:pimeloyl-ACP methyl ester carboxylesterase
LNDQPGFRRYNSYIIFCASAVNTFFGGSLMETKSGYLDINGARIYYEEAGQGFPLVMLHAGIADLRMWDDQFPFFAENYRAIRIDSRGFCRTALPPGDYAYHRDLYGVLQALGVERALLMGCSMGGATTVDFTLEHPEMAAALVLVGSGLSGYQFKGDKPLYLDEMEQAYEAGDLDLASEYAARIWVDSPHRTPDQVDPAVRRKVIEMNKIADSAPSGLGEHQPLEPPAIERLEALRLPILLVVGDLDDPNILRIADTINAHVPGARKVLMTGTAHLPNMERPHEFNQIVSSFIKSLSLPAA